MPGEMRRRACEVLKPAAPTKQGKKVSQRNGWFGGFPIWGTGNGQCTAWRLLGDRRTPSPSGCSATTLDSFTCFPRGVG